MNDTWEPDTDDDSMVLARINGVDIAEGIQIEVPWNCCLPGVAWGNPAQWTEGSVRSYVWIMMHGFMDRGRFEAAAEAARRDPDDVLAAALVLKRQGEAARQARAPWIDATPDMINAAAREADEKRLAHAEAIRSKRASDKGNAARQERKDHELAIVARFYQKVIDEAQRKGGKVPGYRALNQLARREMKLCHAQTEQARQGEEFQLYDKLLTETRARRWLAINNAR